MNEINNKKISQRQFFFLIVQTQIGVGILSLPYDLHQVAKQDGWISLLIAGVILQFVMITMWLLAKRFPNDHLYNILSKTMGKLVGGIVKVIFIIYFIGIASLILMLFSRMINIWILPHTPIWIIILSMTLICMYLVIENILVIARLYTFVSILLVVITTLMLYAMKDAQIIYLFPMGQEGLVPILKGANKAILSLLGFIIILVSFPYTEGSIKGKFKTIIFANWTVILVYFISVITAFTFFGSKEMALVPEPILYLLKDFNFILISRVDMLFLSIWIVSVSTTLSSYLYMSSLGLSNLFGQNNRRPFVFVAGIIIFITAIIPGKDESKIGPFSEIITTSGIYITIILPIVIYVISVIFKRSDVGSENQ